jgi:subtilisin family serine protease
MANMTRTHRGNGRKRRHELKRATRLRVAPLEDRLTPALTAGTSVPGELLIGFQPGLTDSDVAAFYAAYGLSELRDLDAAPGKTIRLVSTPTQQSAALLPTLAHDPRVRYAEPDAVATAAQVPNDPAFARDYGLLNTGQTGGTPDADIDADEAWNITTGSGDVVVAVLDSGVDYTHPDLAANMWHNPGEIPGNKRDDDGNGFVDDYYGYDFVNRDGDPMDFNGHGTHVAGIIGMAGNNAAGSTGVNWNVKIMALQRDTTVGNDSESTSGDTAASIAGIEYATMMRHLYESSGGAQGANVRVINASWGGQVFLSESLKDAIDASGAAGILFVAAAANQADDNDVSPVYPASFDSPNIISVAATDANDRLASFSNWGATSVDLAAPGLMVWSTWAGGGYRFGSGTSMATPHVSGAAALIWSAFPNLTVADVKARLLNSTDYIGDIGGNASYPTVTNGRLNVRNALLYQPPDHETTAPAAIADVGVASTLPWSATLSWTATGDDGPTGRASSYDVRYSSAPITEANWAAATPAAGEPAPRTAGTAEGFTVEGLEPGTEYYFAVKVTDNDGNVSAFSNVARGATAPAALLLDDDVEGGAGNWTATGLWHRSNVRGHDSATAWYLGNDSDRTYFNGTQHNDSLTLAAPIDLSGVTRAVVRFDEWRQVTDFDAPIDTARVLASRNGTDWTTVSESFDSTLDWQRRTIDLTPFAGGPVYLRFDFNCNAFGYPPWAIVQGYEGWHVDNIQVLVPGSQPTGFSVSDVRLVEGNSGATQAVFTVTRSSGAGPATVGFATADGGATAASGDYQAVAGTLTFLPGETRKTVAVTVYGDRLGEPDESFILNLSNPSGGSVIADGQGRATIQDDEPRVLATSILVDPEGDLAGTYAMAVNLSVPSSETVTVHYATADLTATTGTDYFPTSGVLTFAPGETRKLIEISLPRDVTQDAIVEAFLVNFDNASGNAVILKRGVVHIVDDDNNRGNHWGQRNQNGAAAAGGSFAAAGGVGGLAGLTSVSPRSVDRQTPAADWSWVVPPLRLNRHRIDVPAVLSHEAVRRPGHTHAGGPMTGTATDSRLTPFAGDPPSWLADVDGLGADRSPTRRRG